MIIEYTAEEIKDLDENNLHFSKLLFEKTEELKKYQSETKECEQARSEIKELKDKWDATNQAICDKAEKSRVNVFNGNKEKIKEEAIEQIQLILEDYISHYFLPDKNGKYIPYSECENKEPFLSAREARTLIYRGIKPLTDALEGDEKSKKEINKHISDYISASEYIYTQQKTRERKQVGNYKLLNDKTEYALISDFFEKKSINGQMYLAFGVNSAPKKNDPAPVYISLTYKGINAQMSSKLNGFDESVYNAFCTFSYYGIKQLTATEIWRLMNGYHGNARKNPTAAQLKRVAKSIDKMQYTQILMDISNEINQKYITIDDERIIKGVISAYLLPLKSIILESENGKEIAGYSMYEEPILFTYNKAKRHVLTVNYSLLDIDSSNTGYIIEFRDFMLKRITSMKNGVFQKRTIDFYGNDSIYKNAGVPIPKERINAANYSSAGAYNTAIKKEAANDRKKINDILQTWKNKKFIKDFTFEKNATGKYTDVRIYF